MARHRSTAAQAGFSLAELVVTLALLGLIYMAFAGTLDSSARIAKSQGNQADVTESLRYSAAYLLRMGRMAGTGGIPLAAPDASGNLGAMAINVADNVPAGTTGFGTSPVRYADRGTDVLSVRGVLSGILYEVQGATSLAGDPSTGYTLTIQPVSPFTGRSQPVQPVAPGTPIVLASMGELTLAASSGQVRHYGPYCVGIVTAADLQDPHDPNSNLVVKFKATASSQDEQDIIAMNPGGVFQLADPSLVITAGFLNEFVYFVADDDTGKPTLYRFARGDAAAEALIPDISNLQVALGIDLDGNGELFSIGAAAGDDEWFYNVAGEVPTGAQMLGVTRVRISLVGRSADPDRNWTEKMTPPEDALPLSSNEKRYRHRTLTTEITLRSHPPLEAS